MKMQKIIGFICIALSVFGVIASKSTGSESLVPGIIFGILGLILVIKKAKTREEKDILKQNKKEMIKNAQTHIFAKHQAGLPLVQDAECVIGFEQDKFTFNGGGNNFNLDFNKITDICIKTDTEIQSQYVSSVGGAVAGAVVFGPLGAIVGGRAKQKKKKTITQYLIFTYKKDFEIGYLSFAFLQNAFSDVNRTEHWIKDFKSKNVVNNASLNVDL